eukprot:2928161-Pleurochrysis_carterae.AAC.1
MPDRPCISRILAKTLSLSPSSDTLIQTSSSNSASQKHSSAEFSPISSLPLPCLPLQARTHEQPARTTAPAPAPTPTYKSHSPSRSRTGAGRAARGAAEPLPRPTR